MTEISNKEWEIKPEKKFKGIYDKNGRLYKKKKITIIYEDETDFFEDDISEIKLPSPKEIVNYLDKFILGQNMAKKTLAVAIKKLEHRIKYPELEIPKSNILISGNTGCGKTYLIKTLANFSNIPVLELKMTDFSSTGFVGDTMADRFNQLINYEDYNFEEVKSMITNNDFDLIPFVKNAEYAIIYLDEIDKIANITEQGGAGFFKQDLQNELIGFIEDSKVLEGALSTKNMLFVGTGAFVGLEDIIKNRINKKSSIGFQTTNLSKKNNINSENLLSYAKPEDFIKYGFMPELIGRFPTSSHVKTLTEQDLVKILEMPTSYLSNQIETLKQIYEIKINFDKKAKFEISKHSKRLGTNARGLHSIIDKILEPIFYEPEKYDRGIINITKKTVNSAINDPNYF